MIKTFFTIQVALSLVLINKINAQTHSFIQSAELGSNSYNCAIANFNNDNLPDIYLVNFNSPDKLWTQNTDGTFSENSQQIGNSVKFNRSIGVADLNGDNYPDLFIPNDANWNSSSVSDGLPNEVWFNDGTGKFTDSKQQLGNSASNDVALGDIDNDGDIDAVVANFHNTNLNSPVYQSNLIWLNNGNGNFTVSNADIGIGSNQVKLVDVDKDDDLDIILSSQGTDKGTILYLNNGTGGFSKTNNAIKSCSSFDTGDIDNDGDIDLILTNAVRNSSSPVELWFNDGDENFTLSTTLSENINGSDIKLTDIDNDNDLDIVATNGIWKSESPKIWINQGGLQQGIVGEFLLSDIDLGNFQMGKISAADINNDNINDIVISNYSATSKVFFYQNISSITDRHINTKLILYPTVANECLELKGEIKGDNNYTIVGIGGKILENGILKSQNINVSDLPSGEYLLLIKGDRENVLKFIKN